MEGGQAACRLRRPGAGWGLPRSGVDDVPAAARAATPEVEARDRRPIPPGALLWQSAPDCLAVPGRVSGASPAGAAADAHAGTGGD